MKLSTNLQYLAGNLSKKVSKKIQLANTTDKRLSQKILNKSDGVSSDPLYSRGGIDTQNGFNPDIRYRNLFGYSPITNINYRNDLLLFAQNNEIKKAVSTVASEIAIIDTDQEVYPVFPTINITKIDEDKQETAKAINDYINDIFFPQLLMMYGFKEDKLIEVIEEYLTTGKLAYEIIYDNLVRPTEIIGMQPLDPSTLQKVKSGDDIYYIQKAVAGDTKERILVENQVILIEENEFDYGYISYVDSLRRPYNVMQTMQSSKALWFAAKSQVRMHIKLNLGDIARDEAINKLKEAQETMVNEFNFREDGIITFNNEPVSSGYREFFTAETASSGSPEIEEVNSNGPDLTETDSLTYWSKLFWSASDIPIDRIDPASSEGWGFADVNNLRKIEINFAKKINRHRKKLNPLFLKPLIIQLTLKEVEIGIDLTLLDSIKMNWVAFNHYESLAELELLAKRIDIASQMSQFGELEDAEGNTRKMIPISYMMRNYLQLSEESIESMERMRELEQRWLGFGDDKNIRFTYGDANATDEANLANEDIEEETEEEFEGEVTGEETQEADESDAEDILETEDEMF